MIPKKTHQKTVTNQLHDFQGWNPSHHWIFSVPSRELTNISHLGNRKIIDSKCHFFWDMLVPWRVIFLDFIHHFLFWLQITPFSKTSIDFDTTSSKFFPPQTPPGPAVLRHSPPLPRYQWDFEGPWYVASPPTENRERSLFVCFVLEERFRNRRLSSTTQKNN